MRPLPLLLLAALLTGAAFFFAARSERTAAVAALPEPASQDRPLQLADFESQASPGTSSEPASDTPSSPARVPLAQATEPSNADAPGVGGLVLDADGQPVKRAWVALVSEDPPPRGTRSERQRVRTDQQGRFAFNAPVGSRWLVLAQLRGRDRAATCSMASSPAFAAPRHDLELVLEGGFEQPVLVSDDRGHPLPRFEVIVSSIEPTSLRDSWKLYGVDGRMDMLLHRCAFVVEGRSDGHAPRTTRVEAPGDSRPLELLLPRASRVHGTVRTERGLPAQGVEVVVSMPRGSADGPRRQVARAITDDQARFDMDGIEPGFFEIVARRGHALDDWKGGRGQLPARREWTMPPGSVVELDLVLPEGAVVLGRLAPELDCPDPLLELRCREVRELSLRTTPGSDGQFEFTGLPAGSYVLAVQGQDGRVCTTRSFSLAKRERLDLVLGAHQSAAQTVRGRVVLPSGTGQAAELSLVGLGDQALIAVRERTSSAADGSFTLAIDDPGPYRLVAIHGELWAGEVGLDAHTTDLELRLVPCGGIEFASIPYGCKDERWMGLAHLSLRERPVLPHDARRAWPEGCSTFYQPAYLGYGGLDGVFSSHAWSEKVYVVAGRTVRLEVQEQE